jgi:hypothetical protein
MLILYYEHSEFAVGFPRVQVKKHHNNAIVAAVILAAGHDSSDNFCFVDGSKMEWKCMASKVITD